MTTMSQRTQVSSAQENLVKRSPIENQNDYQFGWYKALKAWEIKQLQNLQSHRSKFLDSYFSIASELGEEIGYMLILPLGFWFLEPPLGLHMTFLVGISIGFGNILKNIFQVPRPSTELVWCPKGIQKRDHGFPSTHSTSHVILPFYIFLFYFHLDYIDPTNHTYLIPYWPALFLAVWWCVSIIGSRLYCGYHSPSDVAFGIFLGLFILYAHLTQIRFLLDLWIRRNDLYVILCTLMVGPLALYVHPRPDKPNPAIAESGLVTGTAIGCVGGQWINLHYPIRFETHFHLINHLNYSMGVFVKVAIGLAIIFWVRHFCKKTLNTKVVNFYKSFVNPELKADSAEILNVVSPAQKFLTYYLISSSVVVVTPICWRLIGL
jgi:membrane-associated phospholipid phosphatase